MLSAASNSSRDVHVAKTAHRSLESVADHHSSPRPFPHLHLALAHGLTPGNTRNGAAHSGLLPASRVSQSLLPSLRGNLPAGDEDEEDYDSDDSGDSEFEEDFLPRSSVVIEEINDEAILAAKGAGGVVVSTANTEVSLFGALNGLLCRDEHSQGRDWPGNSVGSRHGGEHGDPA